MATTNEKSFEKEWRYNGVQGDENYNVTCKDCEHLNTCDSVDEIDDCKRFFPYNSCAFCSEAFCGYRWDYPC